MTSQTLTESFLRRVWKKAPPPSRPGPASPAYPLGLNQDQVNSLRLLHSTPQWQTFTVALQAVCETELSRIITGLPHDQYLIACGRLQSKLEVLSLPETIDLKASELDEHQRHSASTAPESRSANAFFGGPWYEYWQRLTTRSPNGTR